MKFSIINSQCAAFVLLGTLVAGISACKPDDCKNTLPEAAELQLDSLFNTVFPAGEPGGAVLIMKGDDVVYDKGFGLVSLQSEGAIDGDTFFNIASCSKQFTAVSVLQLAQAGKIKLDDNVNKYLTEYTDPIWNKITIHHLLCHTSGIPDERGYLSYEQKLSGDDNLAIEYLATLDHLSFEPGEKFEYMNTTYILLSKLVERVSGQTFHEYVREHIFNPASMKEAFYFEPEVADAFPRLAHAYKSVDGQWQESDYGENTFFATGPDGGIYTSTHELAQWERALRSGAILNEEWLNTAWTPRIRNSEKTWYCYGWGCEGEGEELKIYHTGGNGGFRSFIIRYPAQKMLFVVLSNRCDWSLPDLQSKIDQIVSGSPEPRDVLKF